MCVAYLAAMYIQSEKVGAALSYVGDSFIVHLRGRSKNSYTAEQEAETLVTLYIIDGGNTVHQHWNRLCLQQQLTLSAF